MTEEPQRRTRARPAMPDESRVNALEARVVDLTKSMRHHEERQDARYNELGEAIRQGLSAQADTFIKNLDEIRLEIKESTQESVRLVRQAAVDSAVNTLSVVGRAVIGTLATAAAGWFVTTYLKGH